MLADLLEVDPEIEVKIVNGKIKCGKSGGNLKVKGKKADNTALTVTWVNKDGQQFRLLFRAQWETTPGSQWWPFEGAVVEDTGLGVSHGFIVKNESAECKYSVLMAGLELDPVVVVEKKV